MTQEFVTLPREVVKQALEALVRLGTDDDVGRVSWDFAEAGNACFALREALEQPPTVGQEPVGIASYMPGTQGFTMACFTASNVPVGAKLYTKQQGEQGPIYTRPPASQREPLTDEQIAAATGAKPGTRMWIFISAITRAIERAHNINHEG